MPAISETAAFCLAVIFLVAAIYGGVIELVADGAVLKDLESVMGAQSAIRNASAVGPVGTSVSAVEIVFPCCGDQFDAHFLRYEHGWLTAFIVIGSLSLCCGTCAGCVGLAGSVGALQSEGSADSREAGSTPLRLALTGVAGALGSTIGASMFKRWIYGSVANKLTYWGLASLDVRGSINIDYVGTLFADPAPQEGNLEHNLEHALRLGGNTIARNMFAALALAAIVSSVWLRPAGGPLSGALGAAGVMAVLSPAALLLIEAQAAQLFAGYGATQAPGGGWNGHANGALEPTREQNLLIAGIVFLPPALLSVVTVLVLAASSGLRALLSRCLCPSEASRAAGLARLSNLLPLAAARTCATVCSIAIAAPMIAVAGGALADDWELDAGTPFTSAQYDGAATKTSFHEAWTNLIVVMAAAAPLLLCLSLATRALVSEDDMKAAMEGFGDASQSLVGGGGGGLLGVAGLRGSQGEKGEQGETGATATWS